MICMHLVVIELRATEQSSSPICVFLPNDINNGLSWVIFIVCQILYKNTEVFLLNISKKNISPGLMSL